MQTRRPLSFLVLVPLAMLSLASLLAGQTGAPSATAPDVVVYVADVPKSALYELEVWPGSASPGGKMLGLTNTGDNLDPPPENDPHVTIPVQVRPGISYRCWVHLLVGRPKGVSKANMVWIQFTGAVDAANKAVLEPNTRDYLTAQGPEKEGWVWVGPERRVSFKAGTTNIRIQAGMEGVAFDQVVLSPSRYLDKAPTETIVPKSR